MEDQLSEPKTKKEIKKEFDISDENFDFYHHMEVIVKLKDDPKGKFRHKMKMYDMLLERGTVFKYSFEDHFQEELREFVNTVKHTGKVHFLKPSDISQEDLERYQKNLDNERKKN